MRRPLGFLLLVGCALWSGCSKPSSSTTASPSGAPGESSPAAPSGDRPTVAYVTNGIASFWVIAEEGAKAAAEKYDVKLEVRMPSSDGAIANQKRMIEELLTIGVSGIAVSPIDPANQKDILNLIGEQCHFITHDSDAPETNRLTYIGMNNYDAGRMCGELIREAMPEGGSVAIFVGRLDQLNARLRRQGVIDVLLDRPHDPSRYDAPDAQLQGEKYTVTGTFTDNFDFGKAKSITEDVIAKQPDLDCMVGLFAYNPPYMLEALRSADKLGKIKLVAFDEADETLQAIKDGNCVGTIVQNPYRYGYESVRILAGLARGDKSVLPEGEFLDIPARKITKENVNEFWDELKRLTSGASETASEAP